MMTRRRPALASASVFMALSLTACGNLPIGLETPGVTVTSFRVQPSDAMTPRFEIGLNVTNPNAVPLSVDGLAYSISIEGKSVLDGVTNNIDPIEAYGSGDIVITAVPDVIAGVRVLTGLLRGNTDAVSYAFEARLDVGSFIPDIRVRDEGEITLSEN
ncbi:MAG: LEA type 2 family protein [Pseudomonadota bacterium]